MKFVILLAASIFTFAISTSAQTRPAIEFAGDPRLGVCTHFAQGWDVGKIMPLIENSGVGWIRDDFGWEGIEHKRGEYHIPDQTFAWIRSAHEHRIRVLLILNGSNRLYADPYDPQAFANWAAWTAKELKDDIDAVEILNEPNNFGFSKAYGGAHEGEGDSPWVAKYATLMNAAAEAIKAANPSLPVIGFGAGAPVTYKQLGLGTSPAVDAIADHPYSNQSIPEIVPGSAADQQRKFGMSFMDERGSFASFIEGFRKQSTDHHGPRGIWLTEWGFSTYQPLTDNQFGGFSESAQAKYIVRRFVEGMGLGVDVSFLYEFRDGRNPHDAEDGWGLVRENGEEKPSFPAVANMSRGLRDFHRASENEVGAVSVFPIATTPSPAPIVVYRFVDFKGRPAVAIWATDRADGDRQPRVADVELLWGDGVKDLRVIDLMTGKSEPVAFKQAGGRWIKNAMTIPDHPILITSGAPVIAGAAVAQNQLRIFEKSTKWGFSNGQEFPGAAGSFELAAGGDKSVGILHFNFEKGGAYVSTETPIAIPSSVGELRLDVRSNQGLHVTIRLIDATGQCHQFANACSGTGAWETLRVALDKRASEHWGGANDGRIHFPINVLAICVGKSADGAKGTAEFSNARTIAKSGARDDEVNR